MPTTRRGFLKTSSAFAAALGLDAAGLRAASASEDAVEASGEFVYSHLDILGTSLDLTVAAPDKASADAVEAAVLAEIERLRRILSAYDAASELARLNVAPLDTPIRASAELIDVLQAYDAWQQRTRGAFSGRLGGLAALWRRAERENRLPAAAELAAAVAEAALPLWQVDLQRQTVSRLGRQPINVDSLGKGYILDKALVAGRQAAAAATGILLDIGGDIRAWGDKAWRIGVQDPLQPADNAAPLSVILLSGRAVATSAAYERGYTIGGRRYSHVLDPRTGMPATAVSATVVAKDTASANALAAALCAVGPEKGLQLVESADAAECLIVTPEGEQWRSKGFARLEAPATRKERGVAVQTVSLLLAADAWPQGYQMTIDIDINRRGPKPYIFCWITDAEGKYVKTIAAWGNERKYLKSVREWYKAAGGDAQLVKAVTRATRRAGKYTLAWDGKDEKGKAMPRGTYMVWLEVAGERRFYGVKSVKIVCGAEPSSAKLEQTTAFAESPIAYGPTKEQ